MEKSLRVSELANTDSNLLLLENLVSLLVCFEISIVGCIATPTLISYFFGLKFESDSFL